MDHVQHHKSLSVLDNMHKPTLECLDQSCRGKNIMFQQKSKGVTAELLHAAHLYSPSFLVISSTIEFNLVSKFFQTFSGNQSPFETRENTQCFPLLHANH